jgi:hypothetical protein
LVGGMNESRNQFPHIELKFSQQGIAAPNSVGSRPKSSRTQTNLGDRWRHGNSLKSSVSGIVSDWQDRLIEREREQKPDLPKAVPLVLRVDPQDFDAEELRKFGIEVIAELEDGYIIGASAESDPNLTKLEQKIEKFINSERGGTKVCEIWEILDRLRRPEYILSPELQEQWEDIQDEQIYTVDIGIACIGEKSQLSTPPQPKEKYKSDKNYNKARRCCMNGLRRDEEWYILVTT